ncbi:MAG: MFS transporter, partial [Clostridia bacterium]|nr:MFS transporter [Clostridia bacterium]
ILMFIYAPNAPYALKIVMCLGLYCVWSVAYTSVNVPYGSMQSVITTDSDERSSLSTWRSVGAMFAQIPVMILLPKLVYDSKTSNPRGNVFIYIVGVMGLIGFVSFILLRKLTTERVEPAVNNEQKFNYFKTLASFFKNKPMMGVTISSVSYLALIMTATSSMQYVFMCYFKNTDIISIATIIAGLPIGLGIVITKPLLKIFTKKQLCTYPFAISAVASAIATFVKFDNPYVWITFIGIAMFGTCFYLTLMWALVADCIDYQEAKTGRREEGSIYATYSLFRKIAQGVGASVVALALGMTGYSEKLDALSQAPGVPEKIYTMAGALPLIGSLICLFSMHFLYNIEEKKTED